jgi:hypothetical protein
MMTGAPRDPHEDDDIPELRLLPGESRPPDAVRRSLIDRLRHERLIRERWFRDRRSWATAAAVLIAFALGWTSQVLQTRPPRAAPQERYILLLFGAGDSGNGDARVEEYRRWAQRVAASGRTVSGEKLADAAAIVGSDRGPLAGTQLRGFFVVEARTMEEAVEIASKHPHLRHGGTIVVRRIDPT